MQQSGIDESIDEEDWRRKYLLLHKLFTARTQKKYSDRLVGAGGNSWERWDWETSRIPNTASLSSVHHNRPRWRQGYPRKTHKNGLLCTTFSSHHTTLLSLSRLPHSQRVWSTFPLFPQLDPTALHPRTAAPRLFAWLPAIMCCLATSSCATSSCATSSCAPRLFAWPQPPSAVYEMIHRV